MGRSARPIGVDLFAGAGGMTLGFREAGFAVLAAVEYDPIHAAAHEFNFPDCTTKFWFLCAARRFSCRLGELIQLIDAGSCGRQNSDEDSAPCSGDVIAVGARHFLDDSMCPQQAELSADG